MKLAGLRTVWLLPGIYLLYYGQLGVLVPYLGIFLDGRGLSSIEIGQLFAVITLARIAGPSLWASIADRASSPANVLKLGTGLTVLCFTAIYAADGFGAITLILALTMMFWTAVLPQLEVIAMRSVDDDAGRYSKIRMWGSIGFIVFSSLTGWLIDDLGSEAPILVSMLVLLSLFLVSLGLTQEANPHRANAPVSLLKTLSKGVFWMFLLANILLQFSFGPFYGFFSLFLRDLGYSGAVSGLIISLGVVAEIVMFAMAGKLLSRLGVKWAIVLSLLFTTGRWAILSVTDEPSHWVVLSQLIHAFSFGLSHAAAMAFIQDFFPKPLQSRGQALYLGLAFGLGGALGNMMGGYFWMQGEGASLTFMISGAATLIGVLCLLVYPSKAYYSRHSETDRR